jgi:hypothetical protein
MIIHAASGVSVCSDDHEGRHFKPHFEQTVVEITGVGRIDCIRLRLIIYE